MVNSKIDENVVLRMTHYLLQVISSSYKNRQKMCRNFHQIDGLQRVAFAVEMLSCTKNEHDFLNRTTFPDEGTFYVSNIVHEQNCRIGGLIKSACTTGSGKK